MYDQMQMPTGYPYNPYTRAPQQPVNYSQFGQAPNVGMLPGRYIDSDKEIRANEVPMDGSVSYFPTKDFNMIIAKAWSSNGNIQTEIYQRVTQQQPQAPSNTETFIIDKLNAIEQMLTAREANSNVKSRNDYESNKKRSENHG